MPTRDEAPVGAPCWIELFSSDTDRSRAFYGEILGWSSESSGPEYGGYINFSKGGARVAGCMANDGQTGVPDAWTIYLATDDAKATCDTAAAEGGTVIVPAMDVMDLGVMAVLADVGGATIGAWQPGTHKGFGVYGEVGTAGWFELHARDFDASVAFYRDVFKWDAHVASDTDELRYTTLGEGDGQLAGIMDAGAFLPEGAPAAWWVYFAVADTDATLRQVEQLGGAIVEPAVDTPYGRLAQASDPTGARFRLMSGGGA